MIIQQQIVPVENRPKINGNREDYYPSMTPEYITIHETDNTSVGANAQAHANLQSRGNSRVASWHVQLDDKEAIQSIPFNQSALAAGDGANGTGNRKSIHIEICVNSDGDFEKAVQNAAEVTGQLMNQYNIPISNIVQHNHWSGKNCPRNLRSGEKGITWNDFIAIVKDITTLKPAVKAAESTTVIWAGMELKKGQIGRLTILKPINLWKRTGDKLEEVRVLQPGEVYRVYGYDEQHGGQYNVGGTFVTKIDGYIKYETPSKSILDRVNK